MAIKSHQLFYKNKLHSFSLVDFCWRINAGQTKRDTKNVLNTNTEVANSTVYYVFCSLGKALQIYQERGERF